MRRELLHARDERRDADAGAYPDLPLVRPREREAPVGTLDDNEGARLESPGQATCVVAESLDDEGEQAIVVPARRDRERMRLILIAEAYEGELSGLWSLSRMRTETMRPS